MKLTIGHKEIVAGIVMFLDSRGVQGFNPETVHADFTLSRGDNRQLSCTLDEDAPITPATASTEAPKQSAAAQATTTASPARRTEDATAAVAVSTVTPTPVVETEAPVTQAGATESVAEAVAVIEQAAAPVVETEAENLFG